MDHTQILLRPLVSEKGTFLKETPDKEGRTKVGFFVDRKANKFQIRKAVEEIFAVKVLDVNVLVKKPRSRVFVHGRKRQRGTASGYKKAYVTLASGSKIEFFEGV
ncbi:MAG: 50S ribosomal protein L23 [Deltaproteobacteria bacterium]|jgi:large subunit ribosomal protein L23|nr:50S ribosomal protein L23 [Deltaproteobacteria bacterium]